MARRARRIETTDCGDGWFIEARPRGSWTEYVAYRDRGDGFCVPGTLREFCRRRDAEAYVSAARNPARAAIKEA